MSTYSLLKEMFNEMVIKKNAELISHYYHKEFLLYTNGQEMDYGKFLSMHEVIYKTDIEYFVRYDDKTVVESSDRVALRMYIAVSKGGTKPKEMELILIATYKDNKLHRLWELTYPDWSTQEEFSNT